MGPDPEGMIAVMIVAIGCATGVVFGFINMVRAIFTQKSLKGSDRVAEELKALREEVRQLRLQQNDLILATDRPLPRGNLGVLQPESPPVLEARQGP